MQRGFTMAEMVIAIAVTAVVLLAAQSAVMLASRAVPDDRAPAEVRVRGADGMQRMMSELATAKTIIDASMDRVRFTVADRDADGHDEEIEYSWAGKAGDPVVRTASDTSSEEVIPAVEAFAMVYDTSTEQDPAALVTGAEIVLGSSSSILSLSNEAVDDTHLAAECVTPTLPAGAVGYRVTRAVVSLRSNGSATGSSLVQVRSAWNGVPTSAVLEQVVLLESDLTASYAMRAIAFPGAVTVPAGQPVALVLQCASVPKSCDVQIATLALGPASCTSALSSNSGVTWTKSFTKQLNFTLYGKAVTLDTNQTLDRCLNARCTVSAGKGGGASLHGNAQMLNRPVMP